MIWLKDAKGSLCLDLVWKSQFEVVFTPGGLNMIKHAQPMFSNAHTDVTHHDQPWVLGVHGLAMKCQHPGFLTTWPHQPLPSFHTSYLRPRGHWNPPAPTGSTSWGSCALGLRWGQPASPNMSKSCQGHTSYTTIFGVLLWILHCRLWLFCELQSKIND